MVRFNKAQWRGDQDRRGYCFGTILVCYRSSLTYNFAYKSRGGIREQCIMLLPKKPIVSSPDDPRQISLLNSVFKLYELIIKNRIQDQLTAIYDRYQFGFRAGSSCTDAIHVLRRKMDLLEQCGKSFALVALDIRKAYESINTEHGFRFRMDQGGVQAHYIRAMRKLYSSIKCKIELNGSSRSYAKKCGVPQGSCLSPQLFNAMLQLAIDKHIPDWPKHVTPLLYADDIQLIIEKNEVDARNILDKLARALNDLDMKFKPSKCKVLLKG